MSPRNDIANALRELLPDSVAVFAAPPNAVAAPCVVVKLRAAEQIGPCLWSQTYRLTLIGPGGDNEAALEFLEVWLIEIANLLSGRYAQPIGWAEPGTVVSGGQTYLAATLDVIAEIKVPALV